MCRWQLIELSSSVSNISEQQSYADCAKSLETIWLILINIVTNETGLIFQLLKACNCILIQDLSSWKLLLNLDSGRLPISHFCLCMYYYIFVLLILLCTEFFAIQPDNLFLNAGSLQISGGYTWTDVLGQENTQAILDGCLLCEADRNILDIVKSSVSCICLVQALFITKKLQ